MAGALAVRNGDARVPVLAILERFGRYKPMEPESVRKVEVAQNPVLEELKKAWVDYCHLPTGGDVMWNIPAPYISALSLVKKLSYSAKDVEQFSIALGESQDIKYFGSRAGIFLNALINNGKDTDYVIQTRQLSVPIHYFGDGNTKNITVEGDLGAYAGTNMKCGSILVRGNAGMEVGRYMSGGTITVEGHASNMPGRMMRGGVLIIKGDAGDKVGLGMSGDATIHLGGEAGSIVRPKDSARIFQRGKLVHGKRF
ncbi:MAG: hypothetical protein PHF60_03085 [Candidatus ainarchaeum sp.]|nr:hypothetical protein [Candidatus ainarchaeum sp.]